MIIEWIGDGVEVEYVGDGVQVELVQCDVVGQYGVVVKWLL